VSRHAVDPRPQRRRRRAGPLALVAVAVVLGLLAVGAVTAVHRLSGSGSAPDFSGPGTGTVEVVVNAGDSATAIARSLATAGVVKSARAFVNAAGDDPRSRGIAPGTYKLRTRMAAADALGLILSPASRVDVVTVPEGTRLADTLALIAKETRLNLPALTASAGRPGALGLPSYARGSSTPEGFLFPAQYSVAPGADATTFLRSMVERYAQTAEGIRLVARARAVGRDPYDVVIIASIVQDEVSPADYAKAARVIDNRLARGTRLQLDSTVNYALGRKTATVTIADTQIDSPYNTYRHAGLPPTPINSPGAAALEAALNPAVGPWLYWVTTNLATGETKFATTYAEFQRYKAEFDASQR